MKQSQRRQEQDPVIQLITGRMVESKDSKGKMITEFRPFKINPNPLLSDLRKVKGARFSEDEIMTYERLRHKPVRIDRTVFSKTSGEKKLLKSVIKSHNTSLRNAGFDPKTRLNISDSQVLRRL